MYPALIKEEKKVQSKQTHFGSVEACIRGVIGYIEMHGALSVLCISAWMLVCSVPLVSVTCLWKEAAFP